MLVAALPMAAQSTVRASFYSAKFAGRPTSSGEPYNPRKFTAAHRTLPLGSWVEITNTKTGQSVVVRVNDRGPWHRKFGLDLSEAAAKQIGITKANGWAWVKIERINGRKTGLHRVQSLRERGRHQAHLRRSKKGRGGAVPSPRAAGKLRGIQDRP